MHDTLSFAVHVPTEALRLQLVQPMDAPEIKHFGKQAIAQTATFFKDAPLAAIIQDAAEQGVKASKEFYSKSAAALQDGAQATTENADTTGETTKILKGKILETMTTNAD